MVGGTFGCLEADDQIIEFAFFGYGFHYSRMRLNDIRTIIFHLFHDKSLVSDATGWDFTDIENNVRATYPFFSKRASDDVPFYSDAEVKAVEFLFLALSELSDESVLAKFKCYKTSNKVFETLVPTEMAFQDYKFWARKTYWHPVETVIISLGLKPTNKLLELSDVLDSDSYRACKLLTEYFERLELLIAANRSGRLTEDSTPPEILEWFEKQEFSMPEGFVDATRRFQYDEIETQTQPSEDSLSDRERETLLKIVAAMSIKGYRFNPEAARNPATKDIQDDLELLGIGLDQKTILKWLRESAKLISPENFGAD